MRHIFISSTALLLVMFSTLSIAKEVKIGVVNIGLLLEKAPQAKAASTSLEKEFGPQQMQLTKLAKKMTKKQKNLQKNKLIMSESKRLAAEREISMMNRDIQRKKNDIQELVNIRRNEELASLQSIVNKGIKSVGKKEKFDLILYEGIAYTNNKVDVTQKVLNFLNKQFKKKRTDFNK